jgi:hypothetical protein
VRPVASLVIAWVLVVSGAITIVAPAVAHADTRTAAKDEPAELRTTEMCIDQEIADRLAIKRKRRGAVDRLFVKQGRHELTAGGGYYASDLLSGTYLVGGSYTFHMTDETAVEFAGWWTHANADVIRALEETRRFDRAFRSPRGRRRRRDRQQDEPRRRRRRRVRH